MRLSGKPPLLPPRPSPGRSPVRRGMLAILLGSAASCSPADETPAVQSVLLITLDTLRADHLSCYGHPRTTSPHLDQLAKEGALFRFAFSTSSRTAPSHASVMTGLYPSFHTIDIENSKLKLGRNTTTLAERCRDAGLRTAAVVSNPVLKKELGLAQGFNDYDDRFPKPELNRRIREKTADIAARTAIAKLHEFGDDPFFFWLHFQDPHGPYTPPAEDLEQTEPLPEDQRRSQELEPGRNSSGLNAIPEYQQLPGQTQLSEYIRRYDAEIRFMDRKLGEVFQALREQGLEKNTVVIVTADHGEAFGENDYYCAHGHGLGVDQTRVPLLMRGPGIAPGTQLNSAVSNLDVFATVLDLLEIEDNGTHQSHSLKDAVQRGREPAARIGFAESVTQRAAFRGGEYVRLDRYPLSATEFWNSRNPYTKAPYVPLRDPRETVLQPKGWQETRIDQENELVAELRRFSVQADRSREALRKFREKQSLDAEEQENLRQLGYIE